jgi:hypothetical protein
MLESGIFVAATTYVLPYAPRPGERNDEYADKLRAVLTRLRFPDGYVASVA